MNPECSPGTILLPQQLRSTCYTNQMHAVLPYLAGIGCSLCYGIATVLEQVATRRQAAIRSLHPSHMVKLFGQGPYVLGITLDLLGWGLFLLAARTLPLFLDLSFVAASLVVTTIVAQLHTKTKINHSEKGAIALVMLGIILLGVVAQPSTMHSASHHFVVVLEVFPVVLALIGLSWLRTDRSRPAALVLAGCAGLAFGATGIISRVIHISHFDLHTILQPLVIALIAYGALGMIFLAAALQKDTINRVTSTLYSSELAIPSLLGIIFLGDRARHGLWALIVAGFLCVIIGTIAVARVSTQPSPKRG
jgi:hypothetical protein